MVTKKGRRQKAACFLFYLSTRLNDIAICRKKNIFIYMYVKKGTVPGRILPRGWRGAEFF